MIPVVWGIQCIDKYINNAWGWLGCPILLLRSHSKVKQRKG